MPHYARTILLIFDSLLKVKLLFNSIHSENCFVTNGQGIMRKLTKYSLMFLSDHMILSCFIIVLIPIALIYIQKVID